MADIEATADADEQFAAQLKRFVGGVSDGRTHEALVDATVVRLLTEAVGDRNPIYSNPRRAATPPRGGAPPRPRLLMGWGGGARPPPGPAAAREARRGLRGESGWAPPPPPPKPGAKPGGPRAALAEAGFAPPAVT